MKTTLICLMAILAISVSAQDTWKRTLSADSTDAIEDVVTTSYGFAMTGYSNSFGAGKYDLLVMGIDNSGSVLWSKVIGDSEEQMGLKIIEANDGGLIVLGETQSLDSTGRDIVVVKLDSIGNLQWSKSYEGIHGEYAADIFPINEGYVVAGYTWSFTNGPDYLAMVLDNSGDIQIAKYYNGGNSETCFGATLYDGGMVMVGSRAVISTDNTFVIKLDTSASVVWAKEYGGNGVDQANSVVQTADGGYVFTGSTQGFGNGLLDFLMVKIDENGSHEWTRALGTPDWDAAYRINNHDDGFMLAGEGSTGDFQVFCTDNPGIFSWERVYDDDESWARAFTIEPTNDGGFLLAGFSDRSFIGEATDIFLVKSAANGYNCSSNDSADASISTQPVTSSDVTITTGTASLNVGPIDFTETTATFSNIAHCESTGPVGVSKLAQPVSKLEVYPNPSNGLFNIRLNNSEEKIQLKLYDVRGAMVRTATLLSQGQQIRETLNCSTLPKGIYNLNLVGQHTNLNQRIIIQ